jgi:ribonuclease P protein component
VTIARLTERRDFLAANKGKRVATPGFVLLVRARADDSDAKRVGFTVTKKVGNSVIRNRLKRRLRALARQALPVSGVTGADHVLIGRDAGLTRDYAVMAADLCKALERVS